MLIKCGHAMSVSQTTTIRVYSRRVYTHIHIEAIIDPQVL